MDVATNVWLEDAPEAFVFGFGPTQRYVARARRFGADVFAESTPPGGESGVPGSPFYTNLLESWLVNETNTAEVTLLFPARDRN